MTLQLCNFMRWHAQGSNKPQYTSGRSNMCLVGGGGEAKEGQYLVLCLRSQRIHYNHVPVFILDVFESRGVPQYPQKIGSWPPSGYLKPQIRENPTLTIGFSPAPHPRESFFLVTQRKNKGRIKEGKEVLPNLWITETVDMGI